MGDTCSVGVLASKQIDSFVRDGFVKLEEAFPRPLAERCRTALWEVLDEQPDDPTTWHQPVVRIYSHDGPEFAQAAQSPRWVAAIHEVAGEDAVPPPWLGGTTAVRFPVEGDPADDGWHIDGSYLGPDGWYWVNRRSRGRALLMLVLLSDVGELDAPTRIRVGSHHLIPAVLEPYGDEGVSSLAFTPPAEFDDLPIALGDRAGRRRLSLPPVPRARRPTTPRRGATLRWPARRALARWHRRLPPDLNPTPSAHPTPKAGLDPWSGWSGRSLLQT